MEALRTLTSTTVVIPFDNIDTDQIIPARFLRGTTREGLGENLFADWRRDKDGSENPDFPLNAPEARDAQVLVTGDNFGCGSSREHAPWALVEYGIRAVISSSIADIFKNNALKNGLLPVGVPDEIQRLLIDSPGSEVHVDVASRTLRLPDGRSIEFPLDGFAQHCLLEGMDTLDFLMAHEERITQYEELEGKPERNSI